MAAYECAISALPYAAAAIAAAYLVAVVSAAVLARVNDLDYGFVFSPRTLLIIIAAAIAVLFAALIAALAVFSGRGVSEKKKAMSKRVSRAVERRAEKRMSKAKGYLGLSETLTRMRRIRPLKTFLIRAVCIIMGAVILFSFIRCFNAAYTYLRVKYTMDDVSGTYMDYSPRNNAQEVIADTEPHWRLGKNGVTYEKI